MWFQGSLWKLPLPVSGGLQFWTSEMAKHSAFAWHQALARDIMLPNLWIGLYNHPTEWTWTYVFIMMLGVLAIWRLAA